VAAHALCRDPAAAAERYNPSPRPYQVLGELVYSFRDRTIAVMASGRIGRREVNLRHVFAGQNVRIRKVAEPFAIEFAEVCHSWLTSRSFPGDFPRPKSPIDFR